VKAQATALLKRSFSRASSVAYGRDTSTVVEKYMDAVSRADVEGLTALFAPTASVSQRDRVYRGIDEIAGFYRGLWLGGPSVHEIENQFARDGCPLATCAPAPAVSAVASARIAG
jgi:hypothetical protein